MLPTNNGETFRVPQSPTISNSINSPKSDILDVLRGIAAVSVCWCHFGSALSTSALHFPYWELGRYGVQIFFVISGFVIPLSLQRANYKILDFPRFLLRRAARLHPPYLAALVLTFILTEIVFRQQNFTNTHIIVNILWSSVYAHVPKENPVFWTLAVEAQFYLLIGVLFVPFDKFPCWSVAILIPLLLWLGHTPLAEYVIFLKYIEFFLIGHVGYMIYEKKGIQALNWAGLFALLATRQILDVDRHGFTWEPIPGVTVALITITLILSVRMNIPKIMRFPGHISYSLYLIHFVVGMNLIKLFQIHSGPLSGIWIFPLVFSICIAFAWFFWWAIEVPAMKLSARIRYHRFQP